MGDKLGKMVKIRHLILSVFFLNLSADLDRSSTSLIAAENMSLNKDAKIYEVSASSNKMILKSTKIGNCLLYTSPSPRDGLLSRMPSSA